MKKIPDPNKMKKIKGPRLKNSELTHAKIRVTTYLDEDIIENLKRIAADSGNKYQTVLNQTLREALFGKKQGILARISRLEQAVFKTNLA